METVYFLAFTKVRAVLQNRELRFNLRILLCSLLCPVPQHYFLFKECYPVPLPAAAWYGVLGHILQPSTPTCGNGRLDRGIQTCLQNKPKEVVLLFCFRPPYIRSPAYPSQSGAGGRPMFSSQHPNYGNSQAPMMHQPDQYGQVATYPDSLRDLGVFFKLLMNVPPGCKSNTQNKTVKDLKGNPSPRGLSCCLFLFVSGFLFVLLFCFSVFLMVLYCGSSVAACMLTPRPIVSAWLSACLLSFVPERE